MDQKTAQGNLDSLMKAYRGFGAQDSEGRYHYDRVIHAANHHQPFPLQGKNPWELYESVPGWEVASQALTDAARVLWAVIMGTYIDVTVKLSPPRPVGESAEGFSSANMYEVFINDEHVYAFCLEDEANELKSNLERVLSR